MSKTNSGNTFHAKRALLGFVLIGSLALGACNKQPGGQVVALVNGEEITLQELNAELASMQIPDGADKNTVRNLALDNIVIRHLLSDLAKQQGINKDPEYILRDKQLSEALLVQMLAQKTAKSIGDPAPDQIDKAIADNPQMFDKRQILTVDQIAFPKPARDDYLPAIQAAKSIDQTIAALNRLGIRFERRTAQVDTASMPSDMYRQVMLIGSRETFIIPNGSSVTVSQIVSAKPSPVPDDQKRAAATSVLQQTDVAKQLDAKIKASKAEATIVYQQGFAAPANQGANVTKGVLQSTEKVPAPGR